MADPWGLAPVPCTRVILGYQGGGGSEMPSVKALYYYVCGRTLTPPHSSTLAPGCAGLRGGGGPEGSPHVLVHPEVCQGKPPAAVPGAPAAVTAPSWPHGLSPCREQTPRGRLPACGPRLLLLAKDGSSTHGLGSRQLLPCRHQPSFAGGYPRLPTAALTCGHRLGMAVLGARRASPAAPWSNK